MKIFNLDFHIGVRDFSDVCSHFNYQFDTENLSDHIHLTDLKKPNSKYLNFKKNIFSFNRNDSITFYEENKNHLACYDAFYCFYPPSFSLLYDKFDKPIITHIPIRFEYPFFNNPSELNYFIDFLRAGSDEKRIFLIANNRLDKDHTEKILNREVLLIPSYCDYNKSQCSLSNKKVIIDNNRAHNKFDSLDGITHSFQKEYSEEAFFKYSGCIMTPYNNSTMSLFERYSSNMPLFLPSFDFLMKKWFTNHNFALNEISWNKIFNTTPYFIHGETDVNNYKNIKSAEHNFHLCDWLDKEWMSNIILFDSESHLKNSIENTDLKSVSEAMKIENAKRKYKIYKLWETVFKQVFKI